MNNLVVLVLVFGIGSLSTEFAAAENPIRNPETVTLDALVKTYEPVLFTHARHASVAGQCGSCHHQHGGSASCKDCHSLSAAAFKESVTNNFTACRNCHGAADRANPGMPSLKVAYHRACFECHKGMGDIGLDPKGCTEMCHAAKDQRTGKKQ
jgi:Class III cytochrome C family